MMIFNHRMFAMSQVMIKVQLAMMRARRQKTFYTPSLDTKNLKMHHVFQLKSQVPFGRLGDVPVDTSGAKSERISETWLLRGRGGLVGWAPSGPKRRDAGARVASKRRCGAI